jgi:hypothetical protein
VDVIAPVVCALCAATTAACAYLLLAAHRRSASRLLLWSGLCFAGLTLNNGLAFVDLVLVPTVDPSTWRHLVALATLAVQPYGLVCERP